MILEIKKDKNIIPKALNRRNKKLIFEYNCGKMDKVCQFCKASFFKKETMNCCKNGRISLKLYDDPPKLFKELFDNQNEHSKIFYKHIRLLNRLLATSKN